MEYQGQRFSLLSNPKSDACPSFSLEAGKTCPGRLLHQGVPPLGILCRACYAHYGNYQFRNVYMCQLARTAWTRQAVTKDLFHVALIPEIRKAKCRYFRLHASGDFFSVDYILAWIKVCAQLPKVKFWAPTTAHRVELLLPALKALAALPNVCIRPSTAYMQQATPRILGLDAGHAIVVDYGPEQERLVGYMCPTKLHGGTCQTARCRRCWDKNKRDTIGFLVHGMHGKHGKLTWVPEKTIARRKQWSCQFMEEQEDAKKEFHAARAAKRQQWLNSR